MTTIPANLLAAITPSVLSAGGQSLALNGLFLTTSGRPPLSANGVPTVLSFSSPAAVAAYFGANSAEALAAGGGTNGSGVSLGSGYFGSYIGATKTPATMLFAQYPSAAVGAFLRGGVVSGLSLTQLQAITGTLSVVLDGATYTNAALNLSAATSFSSGATIIQTALNAVLPTEGSVTGSITTTVLTVTAVSSGAIIPGQTISGTGVTANTKIVNQLTGAAGGIGTYTVDTSQSATSTAITAKSATVVTYDSVLGAYNIAIGTTGPLSTAAFATGTTAAALMLTLATGAVISQGSAAATPAAYMTSVTTVTQNWAGFTSVFDPDVSGNTNKEAFAAWTNGQNNRYLYVPWDTDVSATTTLPATSSLGYYLQQNNLSGTSPVWCPSDYNYAAFILGFVASIDFTRTNGRTTLAYRGQTGLTPSVTDPTTGNNLAGNPQGQTYGNGYNYYGAFATASQSFQFMQRGTVSGPFQWVDSYVNQIWMNNAFQQALVTLLANSGSIPYNSQGNALIEASLADPINAALNFGAIRGGVTLSAAQIQEVNQNAGANIGTILQTRGWYLQILTASSTVRQNRGSPPMTFWYVDGETVQSFSLASILIQ